MTWSLGPMRNSKPRKPDLRLLVTVRRLPTSPKWSELRIASEISSILSDVGFDAETRFRPVAFPRRNRWKV